MLAVMEREIKSQIDVHHVQTGNGLASPVKAPSYNFGLNLNNAPVIDENYFVGRQEELGILHERLVPPEKSPKRKVLLLSGLGGVGKTQLAVAFAKEHGSAFDSVFWLSAKSELQLRLDLVNLAKRILKIDGREGAEEEDRAINEILSWFSKEDNYRWLIIYDNFDNPKEPGKDGPNNPKEQGKNDPDAYSVKDYFPFSSQGSILITSRQWIYIEQEPLRLEKFRDKDDGLKVLAKRSMRNGIMQNSDAIKLAERLDGLPLALATMGDYLRDCTDSFSDILHDYETSYQELNCHADKLSDYEDYTLYTTWNVSFKKVEAVSQDAANLMRAFAYFDNQKISRELLQYGAKQGPSWFKEVVQSKFKFRKAMACLRNYSFIEVNEPFYGLHKCVHDWALHSLNQHIDGGLLLLAMHCVAKSITWDDKPKYWEKNRAIMGHALRFQQCRIKEALFDPDGKGREVEKLISVSEDTFRLGYLYASQEMFTEAEKMYQWVLEGNETVPGPNHILTLDAANSLGNLYTKQAGKLAEAEQMLQRALEGFEKALGRDHLSTLSTVHNLGNLYYKQGNLAEAEQMYQRALEGKEKTLGRDHMSTLNTVNNLGNLCYHQDKLGEAEQMYQRALEGNEKTRGPDHTSTLDTVYNLGMLYYKQGKLNKAEQMIRRALEGLEKKLGSEHKSTKEAAILLDT